MTECCENCKNYLRLVQYQYTNYGCHNLEMDGYACMAFIDEGEIVWMVGSDPKTAMCECYQERKES